MDSSPRVFQGIFWAILVPVFLTLEFFISLFLLILLPFPANILLTGTIPTAIFVIFVKIQLQRVFNLLHAQAKQRHFEWNIEKISEEYVSLLEKQKSKEDEKE